VQPGGISPCVETREDDRKVFFRDKEDGVRKSRERRSTDSIANSPEAQWSRFDLLQGFSDRPQKPLAQACLPVFVPLVSLSDVDLGLCSKETEAVSSTSLFDFSEGLSPGCARIPISLVGLETAIELLLLRSGQRERAFKVGKALPKLFRELDTLFRGQVPVIEKRACHTEISCNSLRRHSGGSA
jgi:hypothetical protein